MPLFYIALSSVMDTQFSGTSLKVDDNPADVLTVMLLTFMAEKTGASRLKCPQDFHLPSS